MGSPSLDAMQVNSEGGHWLGNPFVAHAQYPMGHGRSLEEGSDNEAFEMGAKMAQIFSGTLFFALVAYLVFSNSTRLSYIQRASLEKRLNVCCQISTIVAALSSFLNFFQVTEVDNWMLPGGRSFVVDVARPIEWIVTCPLMQLSLVLMGGSRIPEYRRVFMPLTALTVLFLGSATLFVDPPTTYILYVASSLCHCVAMFFNRQQIIEHSNGVEGFLTGDSEFRKATLILIGTWFPFPFWFFLSPEGVGLIESLVLVQMGWAFLNITAKFTLIFYLQRIKDNYCNRLKVKREMKGSMAAMAVGDEEWNMFDDEESAPCKVSGELSACIVETMNFLGMAENVERFVRLLQQANISTLEEIETLQREECLKLSLPYDLISALQKRHKVWRLEMVDDAEKGLEAGERHYNMITPTNPAMSKKMFMGSSNDNFAKQTSGSSDWECHATLGTPTDANKQASNGDEPVMPPRIPTNSSNISAAGGKGSGRRKSVPKVYEVPNCANGIDENTIARIVDTRLEKLESKFTHGFDQIMGKLADADRAERASGPILQAQLGTQISSGMDLLTKQMERSQALLESKVEFVFSSQNKQQEEAQTGMQQKLELMAKDLFAAAAGQFDAGSSSTQSISKALAYNSEKLDDMQESQKIVMAALKDSLMQITDGWAQQIIQESKAAAFTLQMKLAKLEEVQEKTHLQVEDAVSKKVEKVVGDGVEDLRMAITLQKDAITDKLQYVSSASTTISSDLGGMVSGREIAELQSLIKQNSQDQSKSIEMGIGVFGNSLRQQIEGMQAQQQAQRLESETKVVSKLDGMVIHLQQHSSSQSVQAAEGMSKKLEEVIDKSTKIQTDVIKEAFLVQRQPLSQLQKAAEDNVKVQQERHQDMQSIINCVLDQASGAKSRSVECCEKLSLLNSHIADMQYQGASMPHHSPSSTHSHSRPQRQSGGSAKNFGQYA